MVINWKVISVYLTGGALGAALGVFTAQFVMDVIEAQKKKQLMEIEEEMTDESVEETEPYNGIPEGRPLTNGWKLKTDSRINYGDAAKEELETIIAKYKQPDEGLEPAPVQYVDDTDSEIAVVDRTKPYPISDEAFSAGMSPKPYKIMKVLFYSGDELCTDTDGKLLDKPEKFLGADLMNKFGGISGDLEVAYIRNELLKVDYHVVLIDDFLKDEEDESPVRERLVRKNDGKDE